MVQKKIYVQSYQNVSGDLSHEKLESIGKMFIFINSCPNNAQQWISFYTSVFQNMSPDETVLTLSRILRGQSPKAYKVIASLLLKRLTTALSLKYAEIHNINNRNVTTIRKGKIDFLKVFSRYTGILTNHPVHFVTEGKNMKVNPSAFIPFCDFGGNMSSVGVKINNFNIPVCNCFQTKVLDDQICYEVNLNIYSNKVNFAKELKTGFLFIMDYNEDRQYPFYLKDDNEVEYTSLADKLIQEDESQHALIYLDTIGENSIFRQCFCGH